MNSRSTEMPNVPVENCLLKTMTKRISEEQDLTFRLQDTSAVLLLSSKGQKEPIILAASPTEGELPDDVKFIVPLEDLEKAYSKFNRTTKHNSPLIAIADINRLLEEEFKCADIIDIRTRVFRRFDPNIVALLETVEPQSRMIKVRSQSGSELTLGGCAPTENSEHLTQLMHLPIEVDACDTGTCENPVFRLAARMRRKANRLLMELKG